MTSGKKKPSKPSHAKPGPRPHSGSSLHSSSSHSSSSSSSSSHNDITDIWTIGTMVDIDGNTRELGKMFNPRIHYNKNYKYGYNYYDPSQYDYGILSDKLYAGLLKDYDEMAERFNSTMLLGGIFTFGIFWAKRDMDDPTAALFNGYDISLIKKLDFKNNIGFTENSTIIVLPLYSDDPVSVEYY